MTDLKKRTEMTMEDKTRLTAKKRRFCESLYELKEIQKDNIFEDICIVKKEPGFAVEDIECDMSKLHEKEELISDIKKNIETTVAICGYKSPG